MVFYICFTNLWVLWEFGLYLYLENSHVLVAMFDLVYYPGILGLFLWTNQGTGIRFKDVGQRC